MASGRSQLRSVSAALAAGAIAFALAASGCWRELALDARGWRCADDSECGDLRCIAGVCGGPGDAGELTFPVRAAFYSGWAAGSHFRPSLGDYAGDEAPVVASHLAAMTYGKFRLAVAEWAGQGTSSDERLERMLEASASSQLRWSVLYYGEMQADPTASALAADLDSLASRFASHSSFARIGGRFVVFVQSNITGTGGDDCSLVTRWKQAVEAMTASPRPYLVMRAVDAHQSCADQPDAWFSRNGTPAVSSGVATSFGIFPGIWPTGSATAPNCRDLAAWYADVRAMVASPAKFHVVTSFNDWAQGSAIESAQEWASASGFGHFLDALHADGQGQPPAVTFADCP